MALFGSALRRDQSLANPQPYQPAWSRGLVDTNPGRTYGDAVRELGMDPQLAFMDMQPGAGGPPPPFRMNDDGTPPSFAPLPGAEQPSRLPNPGGTMPGAMNAPYPPASPGLGGGDGIAPNFSGLTALQAQPFAASHIKPHFFDTDGAGSKILRGIGEFGLALSAGQGNPYALSQLRMREQAANAAREAQQWRTRYDLQRRDKLSDDERERMAPRYFSGSSDQMSYDPATKQVTTIYDAPTDAETYARGMGFEPGTDDYRTAIQDYVLRGNGPTAYGYDVDLEGVRQGNRTALENLRQGNRVSLKRTPGATRPGGGHGMAFRGPPRTTGNVYAPILAKVARGEALTPGEQKVIALYGRGGRGSAGDSSGGGYKEGDVVKNAQGQRLRLSGGKWVPVP